MILTFNEYSKQKRLYQSQRREMIQELNTNKSNPPSSKVVPDVATRKTSNITMMDLVNKKLKFTPKAIKQLSTKAIDIRNKIRSKFSSKIDINQVVSKP